MFRFLLFFVTALLTLCSLTPISAHRLPRFTRGVYVILADNTVNVTVGDSQVLSTQNWTPTLGSWILNYNVVFFTFINSDMQVPPSFVNARDSNSFAAGTKIIFSLGGYSYSQDTAGWTNVFGSTESAQYWAQQVATWPCDGVDLDLESGAGDQPAIAAGIITFIQTLNLLRPNFIITQPGYGYPQVLFESTVVVNAFSTSVPSIAIDAVGIMVYSRSDSLNYLSNYDGRACTSNSCPLCSSANVNFTSGACAVVPDGKILAGLSGSAATADVQAVCGNNPTPGGYMIWFASADNGFQYAGGQGDARINNSTNWLCPGSSPSHCASGQ